MSKFMEFSRFLFRFVPEHNPILLKFCQRYVDRYHGENNSDPATNGEELFLRSELPKLHEKGNCVFDVGANVGNWAKYVLLVNPTIQLHCFEPSRTTFQQLMSHQWPSNVHLNNFGLGETEGNIPLNIVNPSSGLNSVYFRRGVDAARVSATETISISTVDAYCETNGIEYIDFIKVDVEGHELAVFRGMTRMLSQGRVSLIQFEYGGCNLDAKVCLADIWDFLKPFGFNFYKLHSNGPRLIPEYLQSLDSFKYSNYIARKTTD